MMVSMALSACAFLKCSWRAFRRMGSLWPIGLEATEGFLSLQQAGGGPSERHFGVLPAFDVAGDLARRAGDGVNQAKWFPKCESGAAPSANRQGRARLSGAPRSRRRHGGPPANQGVAARDRNLIVQGIAVDFPRAHDIAQDMPDREHRNHNRSSSIQRRIH